MLIVKLVRLQLFEPWWSEADAELLFCMCIV